MARRIKERELKNPTITIIGEGATERVSVSAMTHHPMDPLIHKMLEVSPKCTKKGL